MLSTSESSDGSQKSTSSVNSSDSRTFRRFFGRRSSLASINSNLSLTRSSFLLPRYSRIHLASSGEDGELDTETSTHCLSISIGSDQTTTAGEVTSLTFGYVGPFESDAGVSQTATLVDGDALPPRYSVVPPRYSSVFGTDVEQCDTFPGHIYHLRSGMKSQPWATLRVNNAVVAPLAKQSKHPRFFGGDFISGSLDLNLDSPQSITSIMISLRGRVITGFLDGGTISFLDHPVTLWDRSTGDPRQPTYGTKFDGKLNGKYTFPFSIPFPSFVDISDLSVVSPPFNFPQDVPSESASPPASPTTITPFDVNTPSSPTAPLTKNSIRNPSFLRSLGSTGTSTVRNNPHLQTNYSNNFGSDFSPFGGPVSPIHHPGSKKRIARIPSVVPVSLSASAESHRPGSSKFPSSSESRGNTTDRQIPLLLPRNVYPLPQSFLERGVNANIEYELVVHISHGRLRSDSKMKTNIVYTPSIAPPPFSLGRRSAYQEGAFLPNPDNDPEGWHTLPSTIVRGELLGQRTIELECSLSLAKPLSYTRGTVIPCYLTISSPDTHGLNLLAIPKTPYIRLTRRVHYVQSLNAVLDNQDYHQASMVPHFVFASSSTTMANSGEGKKAGVRPKQSAEPYTTMVPDLPGGEREEMELAVWWIPPKGMPQDPCRRVLEGEIHLPRELQPTCMFAPFSVDYTVEMLPFVSHVFEPEKLSADPFIDPKKQVYLAQPVEIATLHCEGEPIPTAFSEPLLEHSKRKRRRDRETERGSETEILTDRNAFLH